jgi:hypothetical protein
MAKLAFPDHLMSQILPWFFNKLFSCKNMGSEEPLLFLTFFDNINF